MYLYSDEYYKQNPIAKRFVKKFSLSNGEIAELASFSKSNEIFNFVQFTNM